jgi:hypothetical protein
MDIQDLTVYIKCDIDTSGFDLAIKKMKEFKKASKVSLWMLIKLRIMKIFITEPKITIQELIDKERGFSL